MKRSYWIVGAVGVCFLFLGVIMNFLMSFSATRAADRFLSKLSEGQPAQAYEMTTKAYREGMKPQQFNRMTRLWNVKGFTEKEDWETQSGSGQVTLTGNLKSKTGQAVPLRMKLIKEDGEWKVASLQGPPPPDVHYSTYTNLGHWRRRRDDSENPVTPPPLPSQDEINRLVRTSLTDMDKALDQGDYKDFHESVARDWKEHTPVVVFERVLKPFREANVDLRTIADGKPVFEKPVKVRPDGVLTADGKYLVAPHALDFWLHYVLDDDKQWRLISLRLGWRNQSIDEIEDQAATE
ncbi:MAG: hypothetical protein EHM23_11315 [Acidobacteria bacterium]|nr:MAG: hypothetical protein EHM23_11315 [Acidobacteriota bacterium]